MSYLIQLNTQHSRYGACAQAQVYRLSHLTADHLLPLWQPAIKLSSDSDPDPGERKGFVNVLHDYVRRLVRG
jgi:hypothetical protein